jgi:quercetin dioxygenase-like cupin family protein
MQMRLSRSRKRWLVFGAVAVAGAISVGIAVATVTTTVISDTGAGAATDVRLRIVRNEFVPSGDQPSFSSGWHTHPGPIIVQVQEGYLKITDGTTCHPSVVGPGETYIETPAHPLIATADHAATWTTTYILPANAALASATSDPC